MKARGRTRGQEQLLIAGRAGQPRAWMWRASQNAGNRKISARATIKALNSRSAGSGFEAGGADSTTRGSAPGCLGTSACRSPWAHVAPAKWSGAKQTSPGSSPCCKRSRDSCHLVTMPQGTSPTCTPGGTRPAVAIKRAGEAGSWVPMGSCPLLCLSWPPDSGKQHQAPERTAAISPAHIGCFFLSAPKRTVIAILNAMQTVAKQGCKNSYCLK